MVILNPYLSFPRGEAREAMEFYRSVLGGDLVVNTFGEYPGVGAPDEDDMVMHAQLTTPEGIVLMGADTPSVLTYTPPAGIVISLSGDDPDRLQALWDGLVDGGSVTMPYDVPPWGGRFGQLVDRYGVAWMVNSAS